MTMEVSRLAIEVTSTGIETATKALHGGNGRGGLAGAAATAEKNVTKLTDSLGKLMSVNTSGTALAWASSLGQLSQILQGVVAQATMATMAVNAMANGMKNITQQTQAVAQASRESNERMSIFSTTLRAMASAFTIYKGIELAHSIIEANDAWQTSSARIRIVTNDQKQATAVQNALFQSAQNVRVPFEEQVAMFSRMQPVMEKLGYSQKDVVQTTDLFSKVLRISGANTRETQSAMLAFNHTMTEGWMTGRAYNSLAQEAPKFLMILREQLGMTSAEFRAAVSKREITGDKIVEALKGNASEIEATFGKMPVTVSQAIVQLKNDWLRSIGEMSENTDLNNELVGAINMAREMIPGLVQEFGHAFASIMKWIHENRDGFGEIWDQIKGLLKDVWGIVQGTAKWAGSLTDAGQSVNLIALAIYGVRLLVAGIQDGFTAIAGAVAYVGGWIAKAMASPLTLVEMIVAELLDSLAKMLLTFSAAADKLGFTDTAKNLKAAYEATAGMAINIGKSASDSQALGDSLIAVGNDYWGKLANGQGAVAAVLNEEKKVTEEKKKQSDILAGLDDTKGPKPKGEEDTKLQNKLDAETRQAANAMAQLNAQYADLIEHKNRLLAMGSDADKLGPAQRELNKLLAERTALEGDAAKGLDARLVAQKKADLDAQIGQATINAGLERYVNSLQGAIDEEAKLDKNAESRATSLEQEAAQLQAKAVTYGLLKGAVEEYTVAQVNAKIAELEGVSDDSRDEKYLAALYRQRDALQQIAKWKGIVGGKEAEAAYAKAMDPKKLEDFANAAQKSFGKIGQAFGGMVLAAQKWMDKQSQLGKATQEAMKIQDPEKQKQAMQEIATAQKEEIAGMYADMAGSAKGFFAENSRGYKVMADIEKGFRLYQMALQLQQFYQEMFHTQTLTAVKVASNETVATSAVASSTTQVGAAMAAGTANAAAGVANQANGDPYSAFFRMAAMAAIMAALGFAVSGVGSSGTAHLAADRQAAQGTGTVLGDASKQSESIANGIKALKDNSDVSLAYSQGMLASLQNIETALGGVTSYLLRTNQANVTGSGFQNTKTYGAGDGIVGFMSLHPDFLMNLLGPLGSFAQKISGFGSSTSLVDSGITAGPQSVGDIMNNGFQGSTYQDIETKKKAFWMTYSDNITRNTQGLDAATEAQFTDVVKGMVDTVTQAATALGMDATTVSASLAQVTFNLGNLSLKGLSSDEIEKQLEAAFSAFGDQLATAALGPTIGAFQHAGEGLLETAVRVATGVDQANFELEKLGLTAINFTDIINKQGDVGAEIVRQSIEVKEAGTGIGDIIQNMQGTAADIAKTYAALLDIRKGFKDVGLGAYDVTSDLIRAAGGMDALTQSLSDYNKDFFSDAERTQMGLADMSGQFAALGLQMPASKQAFRDLVNSLMAGDAASQELAMKVIGLSGSFSELMDSMSSSISDAQGKLSDAYNAQKDSLTNTISTFQDFTKSLSAFQYSLTTGDLSTATPMEKYQEELAHYQDIQQRAMAGDQDAINQYQQAAQDFLKASQGMYASGDQYSADYQKVLGDTAALESSTSNQVSVAQQQLDALNQQVGQLIDINTSVMTVADAIANLQAVIEANSVVTSTTTNGVDGSHAMGLASVPFDGYVAELHQGERVLTASEARAYNQGSSGDDSAMTDEIRSLRAEVAALRQDAAQQTAAIIASNFDAHDQSSDKIVSGQKDAAKTTNYAGKAKPKLA